MIDKTVLELVDRLVATSNRATKAESDLADLEEQYQQLEDALDVAKTRNLKLNAEIESLSKKLEEQKDSTSYWYKEAKKFEEELKKHDTDGTGST